MKYFSIDVNLSEEDISDLQRGREFNWNWTSNEDKKVVIKIHLFNGEDFLPYTFIKEWEEEE